MGKNNIFKRLLHYFDGKGYFGDDYYPVEAVSKFYKDVSHGEVPEDLARAYYNFNIDDHLLLLEEFIDEYNDRLNDIAGEL